MRSRGSGWPRRLAELVGLAALSVGVLGAPALASASDGPVTSLADGSVTGSVKITQTSKGVSFALGTSRLEDRHAYTVWVMVFNHPEFCSGPARPGLRCGVLDLPPEFGTPGNPRAGFSVAYGGGHVVSRGGPTGFGGRWTAGDNSGVIFGPGLTNPAGAEVQLRIRDHGRAVPGYVDDQIRTFNGGCEPGEPNEGQCADVQTSGL